MTQDADPVRVLVDWLRAENDRCGIELWQVNRPSHHGVPGEGPVDLDHFAREIVRVLTPALGRLNDGRDDA